MQTTMTLDACARCGQPIAPGEPAMQTASVDIIGGRAVSSPVKSYHLKGRCYERRKAAGVPPERSIDGSHEPLTRPRWSHRLAGTRLSPNPKHSHNGRRKT